MAIDTRTSRVGRHDRCKWYKAAYVKGNKLIQDAVAEGVFYANGSKDDRLSRVNVTGNVLTDNKSLSISTFDFVEDIKPDDFVEIDGELFIVVSIEIKGIERSEQFNRRIAAETIITLRA